MLGDVECPFPLQRGSLQEPYLQVGGRKGGGISNLRVKPTFVLHHCAARPMLTDLFGRYVLGTKACMIFDYMNRGQPMFCTVTFVTYKNRHVVSASDDPNTPTQPHVALLS